MSEIMESLHEDHARFVRVLNVLRVKLDKIEKDGNPDLDLILDALDYLDHYGNLYHHPKEDVIYHYHLEHHKAELESVDRLLDEHAKLRVATERMRVDTDGLMHDVVMLREEYARRLRDFVEMQSRHLQSEERFVFPMFEREFSSADWEAVEALAPTRQDPMFGDEVAVQYQALLERIIATTPPQETES